ncbi:hypothetical protein DVH24_019825 [Malus domestica]|uniref:Uncharacterized protein n=1 Tax=Malus domestica TaxID=3750 RepID=A0A498I4S1_MALDO|nr:hypothetical protein DVH24_019825 [Malus domestica]
MRGEITNSKGNDLNANLSPTCNGNAIFIREVKENIVNMGRKDVEVFHALLKWLAMVSFEERTNAIIVDGPRALFFICRFQVVAYLQQIWWFEVDGVVKFPFPADIYTLSFRLHIGRFSKRLGRRVCNFEHTHGWDIKPVRFELSTSDGQQASYECCLDEIEHGDAYGNHKRGCWVEYKVGEFTVTDTDPVTEVKFSMKQIDCTHSKGGLCVDSVSIVPSDLKERKRRGVWK